MARLKLLVIHCTATPPGREVSADDIRRWHTAPPNEGGRGWKQVGYTDMVHLDGTVERLVANNEDDTVDPWEITNGAKGHNQTARHIVYVGGGASDGNHMAEAGIPVVDGCGPAGGGFHSEREFLRLETVEERINMIVNLLKRL